MKLLLLMFAAVVTLAACQAPTSKTNFPNDVDLRHVDTRDLLVALAEERGELYVRSLVNYVSHKRASVMLEMAAGRHDEQLVQALPGQTATQESQQLARWWGRPSPPPATTPAAADNSGGGSWWSRLKNKVTSHSLFKTVKSGTFSYAIDIIVGRFIEPHLGDIAEKLHGKFDCDWLYGQIVGIIEANLDKKGMEYLKTAWGTVHSRFQSMFNDRVCHPVMAKICDHPADIEEKIKTAGGESSLKSYQNMNDAICGSADDDDEDDEDDEGDDSNGLIEDSWSEQSK